MGGFRYDAPPCRRAEWVFGDKPAQKISMARAFVTEVISQVQMAVIRTEAKNTDIEVGWIDCGGAEEGIECCSKLAA